MNEFNLRRFKKTKNKVNQNMKYCFAFFHTHKVIKTAQMFSLVLNDTVNVHGQTQCLANNSTEIIIN